MEKACPRCDKRVDYTDPSCDACGLGFPPPTPPKCPGCSRTVHPESEACGYCGLELRGPSEKTGGKVTLEISLSSMIWPALGLLLIGGYLYNRHALNPLGRDAVKRTTKKAVVAAAPVDDYKENVIDQVLPTEAKLPGGFLVQGSVFDLVTLEPVEEAVIVFKNLDTNDYYGAQTDSAGHYRAWLHPITAGYLITIQHSNYKNKYTLDWTPSIRGLNARTRGYIIRDLKENPPQAEQLYGLPETELNKSFVLIPKK